MRCPLQKDRAKHWQFACPECSFGHGEIGCLAADDEIYCLICLEETDRYVVLHRSLAASEEPDQALPRVSRIAA